MYNVGMNIAFYDYPVSTLPAASYPFGKPGFHSACLFFFILYSFSCSRTTHSSESDTYGYLIFLFAVHDTETGTEYCKFSLASF
jgi:hypothetical protein